MNRKTIGFCLALVVVLAMAEKDRAGSEINPQVRWEYAKLEHGTLSDPKGAEHVFVSWFCDGKEMDTELDADLYEKISGQKAAVRGGSLAEIALLDLLGNQGWEYVDRQTKDEFNYTILFKRLK